MASPHAAGWVEFPGGPDVRSVFSHRSWCGLPSEEPGSNLRGCLGGPVASHPHRSRPLDDSGERVAAPVAVRR